MRLALRHYPSPNERPGRLETTGLLQTGQQAWRASWDAAFNKLVLTPIAPQQERLAGRPDPPFRWQSQTGARAMGWRRVPSSIWQRYAIHRRPRPGDLGCSPVLAQPGASVASLDEQLPAPRDPRQMNAAPGVLSVLGRVFRSLPSKPCEALCWLGRKAISKFRAVAQSLPWRHRCGDKWREALSSGHSRRCLATSSTNYR